ncbi:MAG: PfkB family carbohydrate kinase [Candidatus Poribacteria bacterium]|nr:PfkB family carbohydrate kinase [Candidatus Poribacteria bacterium]
MTSIDVIGGVYGESCAFPHWNQIYGSAGRASAALSTHVDTVRLHTILPEAYVQRIQPIYDAFGVDVCIKAGTQFIGFDYLHCLANPIISPSPDTIQQQDQFEVQADVAVVFGMMECLPKVKADICVYDPQSPSNPKRFNESGSEARRLAFIANNDEIRKLSGKDGLEGAQSVLQTEKAEVVILKNGLNGALIVDTEGQIGKVPAYKTDNVFTIGSGDVFTAAFAYAWGICNFNPLLAAEFGSQAVAKYVETSSLPMISIEDAKNCKREPVNLKGGRVYLAGPFRELGQRILINEARSLICQLGMEVFSPVHDIGHGAAEQVVKKDLDAIEKSDALFVILNGSSPGTLFEVGFAIRGEQQVFCVAQNMRSVDMKLPLGSGCVVHPDFVTALHFLAWRQ